MHLKQQYNREIQSKSDLIKELRESNSELQIENNKLCSNLADLHKELEIKVKEYSILETKYIQISLDSTKLGKKQNETYDDYERLKSTIIDLENELEEKIRIIEKYEEDFVNTEKLLENNELNLKNIHENNQKLEILCKKLKKENEKHRFKIEELELNLNSNIEELDLWRSEYRSLQRSQEITINSIKDENNRVLEELNQRYQDLYNKKIALDEITINFTKQNKELNMKVQNQEYSLQDKNNRILDLESKINKNNEEYGKLIGVINNKDQIIFRLKTSLLSSPVNKERKYEGEESFYDNLKEKEKIIEELELKNKEFMEKFIIVCSENDRLHSLLEVLKR